MDKYERVYLYGGLWRLRVERLWVKFAGSGRECNRCPLA